MTLATIADNIYRDAEQKLHIDGVFHMVQPTDPFPCPLYSGTLVLEWEAEEQEVSQKQRPEVIIYEPSHEPYYKHELDAFTIPQDHFMFGWPSIHNIIFDFSGLSLRKSGDYEIRIYVNDRLHGSVYFHVLDAPSSSENRI